MAQFASPVLNYGDSFSLTFTNPGCYAYRTGLLLVPNHANSILLAGVVNVIDWSNEPPPLTINFPVEGMVFQTPNTYYAPIRLRASVTNVGDFPQVWYFANSNPIGSGTGPDYAMDWNNPAPGPYALLAEATNQQGVVFYSTAVNIAVGPNAHLWGQRMLVEGQAMFFYNMYPASVGTVLASSDDGLTNWHGRGVFQDDKGWGIYVDESSPATNSRFYQIRGISK